RRAVVAGGGHRGVLVVAVVEVALARDAVVVLVEAIGVVAGRPADRLEVLLGLVLRREVGAVAIPRRPAGTVRRLAGRRRRTRGGTTLARLAGARLAPGRRLARAVVTGLAG